LLDDRERYQRKQATRPCGEDAGRSPAEARTLHEGEHDQHDAQRGGECAGQVKPATELALAVRGDQREREQQRDAGQRPANEPRKHIRALSGVPVISV
jgi:hypothetical protein